MDIVMKKQDCLLVERTVEMMDCCSRLILNGFPEYYIAKKRDELYDMCDSIEQRGLCDELNDCYTTSSSYFSRHQSGQISDENLFDATLSLIDLHTIAIDMNFNQLFIDILASALCAFSDEIHKRKLDESFDEYAMMQILSEK